MANEIYKYRTFNLRLSFYKKKQHLIIFDSRFINGCTTSFRILWSPSLGQIHLPVGWFQSPTRDFDYPISMSLPRVRLWQEWPRTVFSINVVLACLYFMADLLRVAPDHLQKFITTEHEICISGTRVTYRGDEWLKRHFMSPQYSNPARHKQGVRRQDPVEQP